MLHFTQAMCQLTRFSGLRHLYFDHMRNVANHKSPSSALLAEGQSVVISITKPILVVKTHCYSVIIL